MKIDELEKLCGEAFPFVFHDAHGVMEKETQLCNAARAMMPKLIALARAAKICEENGILLPDIIQDAMIELERE